MSNEGVRRVIYGMRRRLGHRGLPQKWQYSQFFFRERLIIRSEHGKIKLLNDAA